MLVDLKLAPRYDGMLYLAESFRNPPLLASHHHRELELNLVVRGTITYVVKDKRFTFPQRTLLWMFPAQEHQLVDRSDDAQNYVAVFKSSLIRQACQSRSYDGLKRKRNLGEGVLNTILSPESFDLIRRTMDSSMVGAIDANLLNREAGYGVGPNFAYRHNDPDNLNAGLHYLLLTCWRLQQTSQSTDRSVTLHPAVRKALEMLGGNEAEYDPLKLACDCGVSQAYLSRVFHRQLGVTLTRHRNSLRLGRFWDIYHQSESRNLLHSVYEAGFGSYAQFYKVFTQAYGQGPRKCIKGC